MNFKKIMAIFLVITLVIAFSGCLRKTEAPSDVENPVEDNEDVESPPVEEDDTTEEIENNEDEIIGVHPGDRIPEVSLENEKGLLIGIESYRGEPLVFTIWTSWNEGSKDQIKVLNNVELLLGDRVSFVAIHGTTFDTITQKEAIEMVTELNYNVDFLYDSKGEVQEKFFVGSFPTTYIIDPQGKVYKAYTTLVQEDKLLEDLQHILEELLP